MRLLRADFVNDCLIKIQEGIISEGSGEIMIKEVFLERKRKAL